MDRTVTAAFPECKDTKLCMCVRVCLHKPKIGPHHTWSYVTASLSIDMPADDTPLQKGLF